MKLIGRVTLVFRDKNTGEITKQVTKDNNITNYWIETEIIQAITPEILGESIFISEYSPEGTATDPNLRAISRVHGVGFIPGGSVSPEHFDATSTEFAYSQFFNRFNAPASDITINVIGLCRTIDYNSGTNANVDRVQASVKLSSPCIQTTLETLDIFYRIIVPYDFYKVPSPADRQTTGICAAQSNIIRTSVVTGSRLEFFSQVQSNWNGNLDFTKLSRVSSETGSYDSSTPFNVPVVSGDIDHQKYDVFSDIGIGEGVGSMVGFLAYGQGYHPSINAFTREVTDLGVDVVQNIFGHRSTATLPFHDNAQAALGDGQMTINGDSWTNPDFPKMYRLDITGTGAVGVGTYKFKTRRHFGFVQNAYIETGRVMSSFAFDNKHIYDDFEFGSENIVADTFAEKVRPIFMNYDTFAQAIAITKTELCFVKLNKETGVTFNSTNYPTFVPTNITQVTVNKSNGDVYVACRETGMYKIVDPFGTPVVTKIDSGNTGLTGLTADKCYGVSYGNNRLWSLWGGTLATEGGLFSSTDNGLTWSAAAFTNVAILADFNICKYIKADPTHADQRLAIIYENNAANSGEDMQLTMLWWDEAAGTDTGTTGAQFMAYNRGLGTSTFQDTFVIAEEPWTYFLGVEPSPSQNKWGANTPSVALPVTYQSSSLYPSYFPFGTTTKIQQTGMGLNYQNYCSWELDSTGDQNICCISHTASFEVNFVLYKDDNTFTQSQFYNNVLNSLQGAPTPMYAGAVMYVGNMIHFYWTRADYPSTEYIYFIVSMNEQSSVDGHVDFQHLLWDSYGWNGSAWELDHAGNQTIHSSANVLTDGVTISFQDAGGLSYTSGDYYTVGVCQGVWLDGSTTIEHKTGLYMKKYVTGQTGLESGTLSPTPRSPEIWETFNSFTFQDTNEAEISTYIRNGVINNTYNAGSRSVETSGGTGITNKSSRDTLHSRFIFGINNDMELIDYNIQYIAGLSTTTVEGTGINRNTVAFGIEFVQIVGVRHATVNVVESGITVASNTLTADLTTQASQEFQIDVYNDGSVKYFAYANGVSSVVDQSTTAANRDKILLHTTAAATASIVPYIVDVAINSQILRHGIDFGTTTVANDIHSQRYLNGEPIPTRGMTRRVSDDLYHIFGEFGNSNGRYLPNFFAVDGSQGMSVIIDGVEAVRIADNDTASTLIAGEISVFPREGFFRYSGTDINKSVTATYSCITTE